MIQQSKYPYLFQIMQSIPIKGQISFQYIYQKLFSYYIALEQFKPDLKTLNKKTIIQILRFVFPELGKKVHRIAKYPLGPQMLKALFQEIFPQMSTQDLELIFKDASTTKEFIINLVLYLCPSIREHFLWKEDLPVNGKLSAILNILFPGEAAIHLVNDSIQNGIENSMHTFLDLLFQSKLLSSTAVQNPTPEGPDWLNFQNTLSQYNINYELIPQDVLFQLFSTYKTPEFNIYLTQLKEKMDKDTTKTYKMDPLTFTVWIQYLNDLKTNKKTLYDMPPEIKALLQQYENPQELIQIISNSIGLPIDTPKLNAPLDPETLEQWKKFIFSILNHNGNTPHIPNGDTPHIPNQLLDYFKIISQNIGYQPFPDPNTVSINPTISAKWNIFFDKFQGGHTTFDQMPADLTSFLTNHPNPEEFLRTILKLKDSKVNTNFLNTDINPEMMILWKKYIDDITANKGNLRNIPQELLQYFYKLSANPGNVEYIKHLFAPDLETSTSAPDQINPGTLLIWNQFINDLKAHRVDLKDMPSEIIQLMLKYKSPDEFFKILLPQSNIKVNMNVIPDDTVKQQWINWILKLQNRNSTIYDTPKELKDFFKVISPSVDFQTTLQEINSINPDLLLKWKLFMQDLKQHKKSMYTMPKDLKKYILEMKTPQEFVNLIFKTLDPPLYNPIPTPPEDLFEDWQHFLGGLEKDFNLNGEPVDSVLFSTDFSNYLQNASDDVNYKNTLNNIYQMDQYVKTMFEDFKKKMQQDYNVTLDQMPLKLFFFIFKFENPTDLLRSIIAGYSEDFKLEKLPIEHVYKEYYLVWAKTIYDIFQHETSISPSVKFILKYITKSTPLKSQIEDVIKLHESNALVTRVEKLWRQAKEEIKVHDGLGVFLQFMEGLGEYYGSTEELCEERSRIVDVIDRMKNRFAAKSKCTGEQLLTEFVV